MHFVKKMLAGSAAAVAATTAFAASPAAAAVNDDFSARTSDGCGVVNFIDYGPGASGGGDNDDYVVIHDYCSDGHGVRADIYLNGYFIGSQYNGNGLAGAAVVYDPFKAYGNVIAGDYVYMVVCLVDGASDTSGSKCGDAGHTSTDG